MIATNRRATLDFRHRPSDDQLQCSGSGFKSDHHRPQASIRRYAGTQVRIIRKTLWYLRPKGPESDAGTMAKPRRGFIHSVHYARRFRHTSTCPKGIRRHTFECQALKHPRRYPATPARSPAKRKTPAIVKSLGFFFACEPLKSPRSHVAHCSTKSVFPDLWRSLRGPVTPSTIAG